MVDSKGKKRGIKGDHTEPRGKGKKREVTKGWEIKPLKEEKEEKRKEEEKISH